MQSMNYWKFAALVFFVLLSRGATASEIKLSDWAKSVHEIRLANGMKFLIDSRGESPIFTAYIRFRAGGINEEEGKTGLAHFLEHMAFKGTETIGTTDYAKEKPILDEIEKVGDQLSQEYRKKTDADPKIIEQLKGRLKSLHDDQLKYLVKEGFSKAVVENGGNDQNATTSKDMTSYFVSFPVDKLRTWATMESERIFKPVFREFYEERDVVLEERKMRVDNEPDGQLYQALLETAFQTSPYRNMTIGSVEDVLGLTVGDLKKFWRKYYDPSNAVGVLVGKLDVNETKKILEETFGKVKFEGEGEKKVQFPEEPVQTEERRVTLRIAANPRVWLAYHKPTVPDRDDYVFDVLQQILTDGRSSRLFKRLVLQDKIASGVDMSTSIPGSKLPNVCLLEISIYPGHSADEAIRVLDEELDRIRSEGVTDKELEKAKNRLTMNSLWELQTNNGLASQLSYFEALTGDWRYLQNYLDEIGKIRVADVQAVVVKYLRKENRSIAEILAP